MTRDLKWLSDTVRKAETLEEAQLAVSVFLANQAQMPLRAKVGEPPTLRVVRSKPMYEKTHI